MSVTEANAKDRYHDLLDRCPEPKTLPMSQPSDEEREFKSALETLKVIRKRYDFLAITRTVKVLQEASRLQNIPPEMKGKILQELRKMKLIREIVEFDWLDHPSKVTN